MDNKEIIPLPGYQPPYDLLTAMLQDATQDWRGELESDLPPELMTWRPYPTGPNIGGIMLHIIITEIAWIEWFVLDIETSKEDKQTLLWDQIDVDNAAWPDVPHQPLSWYFNLHDQYRKRILESIKSWPAPNTKKKSPFYNRHLTPTWVLNHVIQHETYHGGQILLLESLYKNQTKT